MRYDFLSNDWFAKVDELVAGAGNLDIPAEMRGVEVNITVTSPAGDTQLFMKDGLFTRGHQPHVATKLTLSKDLARKILIDADTAAGVQAFLAGAMTVDG